ncbi:hypothetical protein TSUD_229630 [Trifolium subterraneum]|uniref:DYW domain-containing protein n=1 Tax=Trifolium subterraneum TaxID=3900 RepID=A0A2Z6M286_TRISU|nr:hypothetical protein TSUD_229630 [Trifolium subterraneum]
MAFRRAFSSSSQFRHTSPGNLNINGKDSTLYRLSDNRKFEELIDVFCQQKRIKEAVDFLHRIHQPSPRVYSTLISVCARNRFLELDGRKKEGFSLFRDLMGSGVRPNEYTFAGVLNACADLAAERVGKEVHGYMTRVGYDPCSFSASALVHVYSKCGNTEIARRVFNQMPRPDLVSWTSLIVGDIHEYLGELSKKMKEEGYVPDTNFVLHDVEEEQKEQNIFYHSEKLAVAFGIISTPAGTPIKLSVLLDVTTTVRRNDGRVAHFMVLWYLEDEEDKDKVNLQLIADPSEYTYLLAVLYNLNFFFSFKVLIGYPPDILVGREINFVFAQFMPQWKIDAAVGEDCALLSS